MEQDIWVHVLIKKMDAITLYAHALKPFETGFKQMCVIVTRESSGSDKTLQSMNQRVIFAVLQCHLHAVRVLKNARTMATFRVSES